MHEHENADAYISRWDGDKDDIDEEDGGTVKMSLQAMRRDQSRSSAAL